MTALVNLTPHPIRVYPPDTPNRIDPGSVTPLLELLPTEPPARLAEVPLGTQRLGVGVPVEYVEFGHIVQPPPKVDGTWYVVALVVALAAAGRGDLLVPYREVRNLDGTVIGCRMLARPV